MLSVVQLCINHPVPLGGLEELVFSSDVGSIASIKAYLKIKSIPLISIESCLLYLCFIVRLSFLRHHFKNVMIFNGVSSLLTVSLDKGIVMECYSFIFVNVYFV